MRWCRALVGSLCLLLLFAAAAGAEPRGISVRLKGPDGAEATVPLYGASHALVVGIDAYRGGWPRLSNAVADARAVAAELERHGFDVTVLADLDSDALVKAFKEFFVVKGDDPDARLFVWFAGHGHTMHGEGFLVPADAPRPGGGPGFRLKALPMRDFGTYVRLARAKHVLAVFDACFAGTVFDSQRALPPAAVTRATTLPVREFLTSGEADQTVSDDGAFRELFVRALRGEEDADANHDGYVTGTEIGLFLTDRLTNLTAQRQTPRYGKLRDKDWDRGDFVFVLPGGGATTASAAPSGGDAEIVFWQSIRDSGDPALFQAYLDRFPDGTFAPIARARANPRGPQAAVATGPHVALKNANLRAEPSTEAAKIGLLAEGARVELTGARGDWLRIRAGGSDVIVPAPGPGRVVAVEVAEGDAVAAGQVLARIREPGARDIRRARVDEAKVALDGARQDLRRTKALFDAGAVSRQALEDATLAFQRAKAELARLEVEAGGADDAMDVTADTDGTVTEVRVEPGQLVRAGAPVVVVRPAEVSGWVWGALLAPAAEPAPQPAPQPAPVAIEIGYPMDPIGREVVVHDALPILARPMHDAPRAGETRPGERITVVGQVRGTSFHQISRDGVVLGYLLGEMSGPGIPPPPPRGRQPPPRR